MEENGLMDICEYVVYVYTHTKQKKIYLKLW